MKTKMFCKCKCRLSVEIEKKEIEKVSGNVLQYGYQDQTLKLFHTEPRALHTEPCSAPAHPCTLENFVVFVKQGS